MHWQVDPDLLVFLSMAVTVPLYYLNSGLVPIHCIDSSLAPSLKAARAGGLNQKILVLLPKSSSCCICLGLGKVLDESTIRTSTQAAMARPPGFPLFCYFCNSLETEMCGIQEGETVCHHTMATTHLFYPVYIYFAFRARTGCSTCE